MRSAESCSRRSFIRDASLFSGLLLLPGGLRAIPAPKTRIRMKLGMVTYQWGKDWDIPTIIGNLMETEIGGVELRVDHAHGVTLSLSKEERKEVRKQFRNSPVEIVGLGTNQQFDYPDRMKLRESVDITIEYIKLSSDIGGTGVKIKPDSFHPGVPKSRTVEQIGKALNQLARIGADYGQQIRLEVHGVETQEINNIKAIIDVADHPNAVLCWNSNPEDLLGNGFEANFNLLKDRLGDTCHVRELDDPSYPYQTLINFLTRMNYQGWVLLECRTEPGDFLKALRQQRKLWLWMLEKAKTS